MDAQFWIYIVIGVIYFLSRLFKKPEEASGEVPGGQPPERRMPQRNSQPSTETPRPLTFEELLREITEGKQPGQPRTPEREVVAEYESYETDTGEEAKGLEEVNVDEVQNARRWKPYEEIPAPTIQRKSLEETMRLQDTIMDFGKFDAFRQTEKKRMLDGYMKIIRNPETLKQAVVMSEILKRKF